MIEAVLLDVGGVFTSPDHDVLRPVIEAAGGDGSPASLDRSHYAGIAALDEVRGVDWTAYHTAVGTAAGVPPEHLAGMVAALRAAMQGSGIWRRVLPGSVAGLQRIAATGVALGVVSNSDGTVEQQLVSSKICQVGAGEGVSVVIVVDSAVAGMEKPDPRIFGIALERLGVPAERTVHVGDTVFADVDGARAAGVRPLHLDPHGFCPRPTGDHEHVRSLADVADLVLRERE